MRRRLFVLVVGALATAYACSFPEVSFEPDTTGADGSVVDALVPPDTASSTSTSSSGGGDSAADAPGEDAGELPIFDEEGGVVTPTTPDAGKIDAAGCNLCDCDGDGYESNKAGGCTTAKLPLDCDDGDRRTHPDAGPYDIDAEAPRNGDWDCSGMVEKLVPENFECAAFSPPVLVLGTPCANRRGFPSPVDCGQRGTLITCKDPPLLGASTCIRDGQGFATQACK